MKVYIKHNQETLEYTEYSKCPKLPEIGDVLDVKGNKYAVYSVISTGWDVFINVKPTGGKLYVMDIGVRCLFNEYCPSVVAKNKVEAIKYLNGKYNYTRKQIQECLITYELSEVQDMIDTLNRRIHDRIKQ